MIFLSRQSAQRRRSLTGICLGTLMLLGGTAALAQIASPIASEPTNEIIPGELVFADLVTTDVDTAVTFYSRVFGWEVRPGSDPGYTELAHDGEIIAAITRFDGDDAAPGDARWLVSISVADVDDAALNIERHGGRVLETPADFPDRGRLAVVSDSQGAVLMLLRASGGDPVRPGHAVGAWGWAELWTDDVAGAVRFYEQALGYRAVQARDANGERPVVLMTQDQPRATVIGISAGRVEPNWLPYVPTADARATLRQIEAAGGAVLVTSDDVDDDDGSFAAIAADPTGGVFAIQQMEAHR